MANIREKINAGWIRCNVVIEVLGKPAEYLSEVLGKAVEQLEKKDYIQVLNKKIHEPIPADQLFSAFTEIEIIIKDMKTLMGFIFEYMPSNVEILEPRDIKLDLNSANDILNHLAVKLHQYDAFAKRINFENRILKYELQKLGKLPKELIETDTKTIKENKSKKK